MLTPFRRLLLVGLTALSFLTLPVRPADIVHAASAIQPLFDLGAISGSPFPSDLYTVADDSQNTGARVNLPRPDCRDYAFDCVEIDLLNELDGFHIQPRVSIPFSGPIDPASVTSRNVFFVRLDRGATEISTPTDEQDAPTIVGVSEVVWDTTTLPHSLHVTSDDVLQQHTRYALIVTSGVRDTDGEPVEPSETFKRFRFGLNLGQASDSGLHAYRKDLLDAIGSAARAGVRPQDVVVASVFTTQSVTSSLEKIRDQIKASTPEPAQFDLPLTLVDGTPSGATLRTVFKVADIITSANPAGVTVSQQIGVLPDRFQTVVARLPQLRFIPGAVGTLAVGKYVSPVYARNGVIPPFGTRTGTPAVLGHDEVLFIAFLPAGAPPAGGWPVVLFGPGQPDDDMWGTPFNVAASLATHGLATVSIQSAWHGYGPKSTVTVRLNSGSKGCPAIGPCALTFPSGGRNSDKNGDGTIVAGEGIIPYAFPGDARSILFTRDAWRQTAADTMQFIEVLREAGVDIDGDGVSELDSARIYYVGFSGGGSRGVSFVAVEPEVRAAVFNSAAAPIDERLSPAGNRPFIGTLLGAHPPYAPRLPSNEWPSLINPPGEPLVAALDCAIDPPTRTPFCYDTAHGGVALGGPLFNENLPLRNQAAIENTVRGALDIQQYLERRAWLGASVTPVAFAPYLRKHPLTGLVPRPMLVLFARGDQTIVNPAMTALLRAGALADRATLFRSDLAYGCNPAPAFEKNAHSFMLRLNGEPRQTIALAAQEQVARFLRSDGTEIMSAGELNDRVNGGVPPRACGLPVFEVGTEQAPVVLPEDLMFIP